MNKNKIMFPSIYLLDIAEANYFYCHSGFRILVSDSKFRFPDSMF